MTRIEDLLFSFLEAPPLARDARLESLCDENADHAHELRRMVAELASLGFLGADPQRVDDQVAAPTTIGPYRIEQLLGQGGMGLVYRASQANLGDRPVALKMIRPEFVADPRAEARFLREALLASRLDHPNLCPVLDVGRHAGMPYLVMPLLEGQTLAQRIAAARENSDVSVAPQVSDDGRTTPAWSAIVTMIEKLARGLQAAHESGLVHRDVKPGNVIVKPNGEPVLLDFGLARAPEDDDAHLTMTDEVLGTPAYMAPEQIAPRGRALDARTDVHALGAVLYECLSLRLPYQAATKDEFARKILDEPLVDIRRHRPALPRDLATVVQVALEKSPARRYASALAFAEDLRRVRAREPIVARRPSLAHRAGQWIARNPWPTAAGAVLVIGLAVSLWLLASLRRQETSSRALALVGASRATTDRDLSLSLALALRANQVEDRPETRDQLQRATRQMREIAIVSEFRSDVLAVGFAKDGASIAAAGAGGTLLVCGRDGQVAHRYDLGSAVEAATPFETADGLAWFAACADGRMRIWQPGHEPLVVGPAVEPIAGTTAFTDRAALSADGRRVLIGTKHGDAYVISVPDGVVERRLRLGAGGAPIKILACQFAERHGVVLGDERGIVSYFAAGSDDGPTWTFEHEPSNAILRIAVDGDGTRAIASLGDAPGMLACSLTDGTSELVCDSRFPVKDLATTPEGDGFAAGMLDGTIALWRFDEEHPRRVLIGHRNGVLALAFAPSGDRLVSGSEDYTVRVWDREGRMLIALPGHSERVRAVAIDPAAERIASGSSDLQMRIWRVAEGIPSAENPLFPTESFARMRFGREPNRAWVADNVASLVWSADWSTGALTALEGTRPDDGAGSALVGALQLDLDRREERLLIGRNATVDLYDVRSGALIDRLPGGMGVVGSDLTDDGRTVVVVRQGGMRRPPWLRVWDVSDGHLVLRHETELDVWQRPLGYLVRADLSPDESSVCVCRYDGTVQIYDLQGNALGEPLDHSASEGLPSFRATMSRDGSMLLTTGMNGVVKLWTRQPNSGWRSRSLTSFETRARNAEFDRDERRVVVGSDDGVLRVLALDGHVLHEFVRPEAPFLHARFTDDGAHVVATTGDGRLMQFMLDTDELRATAVHLGIRDLYEGERAAYAEILDGSK